MVCLQNSQIAEEDGLYLMIKFFLITFNVLILTIRLLIASVNDREIKNKQ